MSGVEHRSLKRIIVTNRSVIDADPSLVNINPVATGILVNGAPISSSPQNGDILQVVTTSAQSYKVMNIDGLIETRQENFEIAWYTSSGEFDRPKASADEEVKYKGDTPSSITVAVVRDERGGIAILPNP